MLIPLATVWNEVEATTGPAHGAMRSKLKRWFWCASFTGEYESSSATLAERDAPALKSWLTGGDEPEAVRAFEWNPERWRTVTTRQQGLYRATIALTLLQRPRDFHTGAPLTPELIEAGKIDDHHLFPRAYLRSVGKGDTVDSVLNHCLIDRATNIRIGRQAPSAYLEEMRTELGPILDEVLRSHRLPTGRTSPLATDDFEAFLDWREQALDEALAAVTGKAPPPAPVGRPSDRRSTAGRRRGTGAAPDHHRYARRRARRTATPCEPEDQRAHRQRTTPESGHGKRPLRLTRRQAGILRPPRAPGRAHLQDALAAV